MPVEYVKVFESLRRYDGEFYADCQYFGALFLYNKFGCVKKYGDCNEYPIFLRSLFKPIQASILAEFSVLDNFCFNDSELAIMQASHSGEKIHTDLIFSILNKIGLSESDLLCPAIPPLNPDAAMDAKISPSPVYNNCSGKHSMMLAVCVKNGFDIKTYLDFKHPVQRAILDKLICLSGCKNPLESLDGCNAPVYGIPVSNIANAFLNLYEDEKYDFLKNAYKKNPYVIGGIDNFGLRNDSFIMNLDSKFISKTGAGGLLSIYNDETKEILIVKMAQDNNQVRLKVALDAIYKLGWVREIFYNDNLYTESNISIGKFKAYTF